jgi:hypothetical protein
VRYPECRGVPHVPRRLFRGDTCCRPSCTWVKISGQNGSRTRGLGSLTYKKLLFEEIPDALHVVAHPEDHRVVEYSTVRSYAALAWTDREVHMSLGDPLIPNCPETEELPAAYPGA